MLGSVRFLTHTAFAADPLPDPITTEIRRRLFSLMFSSDKSMCDTT
jgi:hypothetical protein